MEVLVALHEYRHLATAGAVGDEGGGDALALAVAHGGHGQVDLALMRLGTGGDGVQARLQALEAGEQFLGVAVDGAGLQYIRQLAVPQPVLQFGLAFAEQSAQFLVATAFGDQVERFGAGAGDFEMAGQCFS
ncbi:hypothetical protein D3C76_710340 [compost metagenome]